MNVLFLTHRLPYAPDRGDRIRAFHLLRHLAEWSDVHLISLVHDDAEASRAGDVADVVASVALVPVTRTRNRIRGGLALAGATPLTHHLLHGPSWDRAVHAATSRAAPDLVVAYCTGIADRALAAPLARVPLLLDMVDVDSEKWADLARRARGPMRWIYRREARLLARFEREVAHRARATLVTTPREQAALALVAPEARIEVVGNGVDIDGFRPPGPPAGSTTIVFCGVMNYQPNVDAARWLAHEIWPLVRRARPDARLQLVGADPASAVRQLDRLEGVEVTGRVDDVRRYLWGAAAAVAPLRTARGIQNKVLEGLAAGLPVVVTPAVRAGLPPEALPGCLEAGEPEPFARAIIELLAASPGQRRQRALEASVDRLRWPARLAPLRGLVGELTGRKL